ncbi:MAG: uroporphyrinogen decarboxylase [Gammaproteobacteria bacterium]|jgi:uroporphyrinogen decarboxylase|nr:uroporphyrinogen decarboxylase [Gammaproteobacteria bacterium]
MQSSFRFIKALARQDVDSTPVWFMRQAGRYLPEYRAIREKVGGFLGMCKNPQIACEITLQPIQRYQLDAAIIFSDILTIPDAMGLGLYFQANEGPHFKDPIRSMRQVQNLPIPDMQTELRYVMDAVSLVSHEFKNRVPLIGFCGSPWTVATYMVEGKSSKQFSLIKSMLYNEPATLLALLDKVTTTSCLYLQAQIESGANAVMIFDTWGGVLSPENYRQFSLRFMEKIVHYLKSNPITKSIPIILFTKQGGQHLKEMAQTGCDAIGIDWTVDIGHARQLVGHQVALQGNLDPSVLYATPENIEQQVKATLAQFGHGNGHVFNLGHGIYPDIPPEHVQAMIDAVRKYSPAYHQQGKVT